MNECEWLFVCLFDVRFLLRLRSWSTHAHAHAILAQTHTHTCTRAHTLAYSLSFACREGCYIYAYPRGACGVFRTQCAMLGAFSDIQCQGIEIALHTHTLARRETGTETDASTYVHISLYIFVNIFPHNWYAAQHIQTYKCRPWFSRCVADNSQFNVHYIHNTRMWIYMHVWKYVW